MRAYIKRLERRIDKLEALAGLSAEARQAQEFSKLLAFLTTAEVKIAIDLHTEIVALTEEETIKIGLDDASRQKLDDLKDACAKLYLRSTTRQERYPLLWSSFDRVR